MAAALEALRVKLEELPPLSPVDDAGSEASPGEDDNDNSIASPISLRIPVGVLRICRVFAIGWLCVRLTISQNRLRVVWCDLQRLDFSGLMGGDEAGEIDHELREVQKGDKMARQLNELSGPTRGIMVQERMKCRD